jgi:hypothetical protein
MEITPYTTPVSQLLQMGKVDFGKPHPNYLDLGIAREHIPDLCRLLLDMPLLDLPSELPEVYAQVHAWRALGQLKAVEAIGALIKVLLMLDHDDDDYIQSELPDVFGMIGPDAIPPLVELLHNEQRGLYTRACAGESLAKIATAFPASSETCRLAFNGVLAHCKENDPTLNGFVVCNLVDIGAKTSIRAIRRAYSLDTVDEDIVGNLDEVEKLLGV